MSELLKPKRLAILLLLITFGSVMGLLFTPALPGLGKDFGVPETEAQWTMSIFLVGYCLGQLPYGPLANRFGRKKALMIGSVLALFGSLLAFAAPAFWVLCVARFIMAIGSSVGLKVTFTMIGDQHAGASATRAISFLSLSFGLMPGLAIAAGGFIAAFAGWKGCFLFLAFYSLLLGLLSQALPETAKKLDPDALQIKRIACSYGRQFKDSFLVLHAVLMGLTTAMIYIFATLSPYLGIERLGLTLPQFGLWNLIPSAGLVCGSLTSNRVAGKIDARISMLTGILLILIGTLIMAICFAAGAIASWNLFFTQFLIQFGTNLIWANSSSKVMSEATDKSNAAAVMQCINIAGACLGTFAVSFFTPTSLVLLPGSFGIILVALIGVWLSLKKHHELRP